MRLGQYFLIIYREKIPSNVFRVNANKQENNNQEKVDFLFTKEKSKQGKSKANQSNEKVHHSKDDIKTKPYLNIISKSWLKKLVFKFQQFGEMVESLEDDSLHFILKFIQIYQSQIKTWTL